jgi:TonB-dependent SusC/RagA subfamily outer membrane receptor
MSRTTHAPLPRPRILRLVALAAVTLAGCVHATPDPQGQRPAPSAARDDSVQVGYGKQARRDVTGAISSIDGDAARQATATSFADLIEGRVPGLEVRRLSNGRVAVRIRGARSINGSGDPLYVVDGVPRQSPDGAFPDLDPREIQSIEVLKDAGSLAVYGSRGANGVILITMKKGS